MRALAVLAALVTIGVLVSAADFKVPPLTGRVVDLAGFFTETEREEVTAAIRQLEQASGGQMVVAVLNDLGSASIEEAGIALGEAWQIGHKGRDNGAILIIVPEEHWIRLEVGYGWEGEINDALAGDIIREVAAFFQENRYADGVIYAIGKVQALVTGQAPANIKSAPNSDKGARIWDIVLPLLGFIAIGILLFLCGGDGGDGGFGGFRGGDGGFDGGGGGFGGGGASGRW